MPQAHRARAWASSSRRSFGLPWRWPLVPGPTRRAGRSAHQRLRSRAAARQDRTRLPWSSRSGASPSKSGCSRRGSSRSGPRQTGGCGMAYDEGLAERIRGVLDDQAGVSEKRMFGGIAFLVNGHMGVGIVQDKLMVRVGPESYERVLRERHARKMDFTGRPMKGFVYVVPSGYERDGDLE